MALDRLPAARAPHRVP